MVLCPLDSIAPDLFSSYGFNQLIDIPTRVTENSVSLISLIFVNKPDDINCHGTLQRIADHDGVLVSFNTKSLKPKIKTRTVYDYKNADIEGLTKYIKEFDFENTVFGCSVQNQCSVYTNILTEAISKFIPTKTVTIRPFQAPWTNTYTRLLLRKKNRNYSIYKKYEIEYRNILSNPDPNQQIETQLLNKRNCAFKKSRQSANESLKANRRAKNAYSNTVNALLMNPSVSAKKKFGILLKLMKNHKSATTPPLIEDENIIIDSKEKSNLFNNFFASKSTVQNFDDLPPQLEPTDGINNLEVLNTSPIEVAKIIRLLKKSSFSHCGVPGKFLGLISTLIPFHVWIIQ